MKNKIESIINNFIKNYKREPLVLFVSDDPMTLDFEIDNCGIVNNSKNLNDKDVYELFHKCREEKKAIILKSLFNFPKDINFMSHNCNEELDHLAAIIIFSRNGELLLMRDRSQNICAYHQSEIKIIGD